MRWWTAAARKCSLTGRNLNPSFMLMGDIGNGAGTAIWGAVSAGAGYVLTYALAGVSTLMGCFFHGVYWTKRK